MAKRRAIPQIGRALFGLVQIGARDEARMIKKVVQIRPADSKPGSAVDIADALDAEIDTMWGLVAALQTIFGEHDGDPYVRGALRLANNHLDALAAIGRDVDRL